MNTTSYVSFDDKATHAMGVAFDNACKSVSYFGVAVTAHSFIALRIIEAAQAASATRRVSTRKVWRWIKVSASEEIRLPSPSMLQEAVLQCWLGQPRTMSAMARSLPNGASQRNE